MRLSGVFALGFSLLVSAVCSSGSSSSSTESPAIIPTLAPATATTTEPVGATGSVLTFPTVQGLTATLVVPPGMAQPGAIATLTSAIGPLPRAPNYVYGLAAETFAISLSRKAGFHSPAITLVVPPITGGNFGITVFSSGGDYYQFQANANPLILGTGTSCIAANPGTIAMYYSVLANAAVTIPTPLPGPSTCP